MSIASLESELRRRGVSSTAFSLGANKDEAYCLIAVPGGWAVYYSERGNRNDERSHEFEDSACRDLLDRVLSDGLVAG